MTPDLFSPIRMGDLDLPNRVVMAPLTRSRAKNAGVMQAMNAEYYRQRATAGLIVAEATQISQQGQGYAWTPGIYTPEQVEGWRGVTSAVHEAGGRIVLQLWHVGRISHPSLQKDGALPVAPSAIKPTDGQAFTETGFQDFVTPRALRTDELPGLVADYAAATRNAFAAGFDGVEIHAANGYLLNQFLCTGTNYRTDQYGGTLDNRVRLLDEVCAAVVEAAGGPSRVGIRISPVSPANGCYDANPTATFVRAVEVIEKHKLVYMHCIEGATMGPREVAGGFDLQILRRMFSGLYMANNAYDDALAETQVRNGHADLIAFGRLYIANPDLVARLRNHAPLNVDDRSTWYGGDAHGYTDYPTMDAKKAA